MSITTASQSQLGQDTAKNSQIVTTSVKLINSGASTGPLITSIIVTDNNYNNLDDTAVGTSNSFIKIIGSGFINGANVFVGGTQVPAANVTFTSSTEVRVRLPVLTSGTNNAVSLFNSTGSGAIFASNLFASGFPTVTTSSYTAESVDVSTQLLATGDGTLSYSLKSGSSLPAGLSLSSTGLISGTVTVNSTTIFTVLVDDSQGQTTQQDITLVINGLDPYYQYTSLLLQADNTSNNSNNGVFVDSSINSFTITPTANVIQGTVNPFGVGTWSNYFTGNGLTIAASSDMAVGTNDFTFETWIYPTAMVTWNSIISTRPTAATAGFSNVWVLGFHSTGYPYIYSGDFQATGSVGAIANNTWTHVAVSRSGSTMRLFVNGILANTATSSQNYTDNTATIAGNNDGSEYFTGYISNARLLKGTALYTSAFTPSTTPLTAVANTVLLTCRSNRFKDDSNNALTLTAAGNSSVERFNPFGLNTIGYANTTYSGSYYFNGNLGYLQTPMTPQLKLGANNFTIECWAYINAYGSQGVVFGGPWQTPSPTFNNGAWILGILTTGATPNLIFNSSTTGTDTISLTSPITISKNTWNHFAVVRNGNNLSSYFNGNLVTSNTNYTMTINPSSTQNTYIGYNPANGISPGFLDMNGYISNFRVVNGTAVYTSAFTPSTTPLQPIANTVLLLTGENSGIYDATLQNNIRTAGDTKVRTNIAKYGTGSMFFDGTTDYAVVPTTTNFGYGTGDFTIEFWMYLNSIVDDQSIISNLTSVSSVNPHLYFTQVNRLLIYQTNNATRISSSGSGALSASTWYHVALCRSSGSTKMFINGTQVGSTYTDSNNYGTSAPLAIGTYWSSGTPVTTNTFNGYLDDIRITKGYARYTANFTPPNSALKNK
jgi:hypothetical protein